MSSNLWRLKPRGVKVMCLIIRIRYYNRQRSAVVMGEWLTLSSVEVFYKTCCKKCNKPYVTKPPSLYWKYEINRHMANNISLGVTGTYWYFISSFISVVLCQSETALFSKNFQIRNSKLLTKTNNATWDSATPRRRSCSKDNTDIVRVLFKIFYLYVCNSPQQKRMQVPEWYQ